MSTYLQLCNSLIQKCGISGGSLTTVVGQTGESGRVASWIDEAYTNIQLTEPRWWWMRAPVSFTTVASQGSYTPTDCGLSDFGLWKMDSFRRYVTTTGTSSEQFLTPISYDNYRDTYLFGMMRTSYGDPRYISEGPDRSLNLGLIPGSVGYTVVGEYFKAPTSLTADADMPALPSQYHMLIVYRAMMMYGMYEAANETYQEGMNLYNSMLRRVMRDQMDDVCVGAALA